MPGSSLSSIVVPREGYTLADDPISLSFSGREENVLFLAVPPSSEAIAAASDDIRFLLKGIFGGVFFISDTDEPTSLNPQDPTLLKLCSDFGAFVLPHGCRRQEGRVLAALDLERGSGSVSHDVSEYVAKQFSDTLDPNANCLRSVAMYDRELTERKKTEEYSDAIKELSRILSGIEDVHFVFDLEGTLVGYHLDPQNHLQRLSYVLRPFAAEILAILSENNTVSLCTLATRTLVRAILTQTNLCLPVDTNIMSAEDIRRMNESRRLTDTRVKVPSWYGDILVDDHYIEHADRTKVAGFSDEEHRFMGIRTFDFETLSSLKTLVHESDVLNLAKRLAKRFKPS